MIAAQTSFLVSAPMRSPEETAAMQAILGRVSSLIEDAFPLSQDVDPKKTRQRLYVRLAIAGAVSAVRNEYELNEWQMKGDI